MDSQEHLRDEIIKALKEEGPPTADPSAPLLDAIRNVASAKAHLLEVRRPERRESSAVIFAASSEYRLAEEELNKRLSKMIDGEVDRLRREAQ